MKKTLIALLLAVTMTIPVNANELELMRVTCYCVNSGVTASGKKPVPNYTCGARRDLIGCVALIYADDNGKPGEFIGLYEIQDTGNAPRIQTGLSLDIYQTTLQDCKDYIKQWGDYQWVQIVRGDG